MNYCTHIRKYLVLIGILICSFSCIKPVARRPVSGKTTTAIDASVNYNKNLNAHEEKVFKLLMEQDSLSTYHNSSHGFWYKINEKSEEEYRPKFGDKLTYEMEIYDLDYEVIYFKQDIGVQSYVVDQQEIQEGLRNGLMLMNEGDIYTFMFPSHKMFGYIPIA